MPPQLRSYTSPKPSCLLQGLEALDRITASPNMFRHAIGALKCAVELVSRVEAAQRPGMQPPEQTACPNELIAAPPPGCEEHITCPNEVLTHCPGPV